MTSIDISRVRQQYPINVSYEGHTVGEYYADLLVDEEIIVETKAAKKLDDAHTAQCLNYLKATDLRICLLLNFGGMRVEIKRIVNNFGQL